MRPRLCARNVGGARRVEHGVGVLRHRPSPLLVGHVLSATSGRPDPRVSNEDVEASELRSARSNREQSGGVGLEGKAASVAGLGEPLDNVGSFVLPRSIADANVGTAFGEQERRRRADAPRAAGDERALSSKRDHDASSVSMISQIACSIHR
jgi:hypothetical protein